MRDVQDFKVIEFIPTHWGIDSCTTRENFIRLLRFLPNNRSHYGTHSLYRRWEDRFPARKVCVGRELKNGNARRSLSSAWNREGKYHGGYRCHNERKMEAKKYSSHCGRSNAADHLYDKGAH
jgi:hypothetical protein